MPDLAGKPFEVVRITDPANRWTGFARWIIWRSVFTWSATGGKLGDDLQLVEQGTVFRGWGAVARERTSELLESGLNAGAVARRLSEEPS